MIRTERQLKFQSSKGAKQRNQQGESLVGIIVSLTISVFVASGMMGLAYLNSTSNMRVMNKCDSVNAARTAIDQISSSVRTARCVGSLWGQTALPPAPPAPPSGTSTGAIPVMESPIQNHSTGYIDYPAPGDPFYGTNPAAGNGTPPEGWPSSAAWAKDGGVIDQGAKWRCSQTCLIVQVPVFDASGVPIGILWPENTPQPVMDTIVYRVSPDTANDAQANTFKMEKAIFPAQGVPRPPGYQASSQPKVILRGIIGPFDPSGNGSLRVFQYLSNTNPETPVFDPSNNNINTIGGVSVNVEVLRQDAGVTNQAALQFKSDVYMRNNIAFTN